MATKYRIIIQNDHNQDGSYTTFSSPPQVTEDVTAQTVYSNAWITQRIPDDGNFTIDITKSFFAWTGTTASSPAPGVVVRGGLGRPAQLGDASGPGSNWPMTVKDGVPTFGKETIDAKPGSFRISTDTSFTLPNDTYLIGLGQYDKNGIIVPIACARANNNAVTAITPIMKFYVAASSFSEGEIVDYQTFTRNAGLVDFSRGAGLSKHTAVVHHKADGSFETLYFAGPQTAAVLAAAKAGTLTAFVGNEAHTEKRVQLRQAINTLSVLLDTFDLDLQPASAASPWKYLAKMGWPATTAAAVIVAGAAMTVTAMGILGYQVDFKEETSSPDGTKKIRSYSLKKRDSLARNAIADDSLEQARRDWALAVAKDTQRDGHTNEGVEALLSGGRLLTEGEDEGGQEWNVTDSSATRTRM